jgi:type VI secretion system protein ImpJ
MTERAVHWHEGMFLLPQHFQLASRHVASVSYLQTTYALHHYWGLRAIDLDADALAASRFVVRSLKARLLDGTAVELPADGVLPPLELKPALEKQSSVTVYLALPVFNLNQPNASDSADPHSRRFRVESVSLPDENTGTDPQAVQVRLLNLRLLISGEDRIGYETIPLARIVRSARAEALPELDRSYIPPLLACDAWAVLQREILQSIAERLTQKIDLLATQLVTRNVGIDSSGADGLLIAQLRQLNEAQATLHVVAYTPGIHPLAAFLELCRIVGQLAFLGPTRRAAELPRYDHDDLGRCFWALEATDRRIARRGSRAGLQGAGVRRGGYTHAGDARTSLGGAGLANVHRRARVADDRRDDHAADQAGPTGHEGRQQRAGWTASSA